MPLPGMQVLPFPWQDSRLCRAATSYHLFEGGGAAPACRSGCPSYFVYHRVVVLIIREVGWGNNFRHDLVCVPNVLGNESLELDLAAACQACRGVPPLDPPWTPLAGPSYR